MANRDPDPAQPGKSPADKSQGVNYLKYSGMAFQLAAAIFLGTMIGKYIDGKLNLEKPYFTLLLALLGVIAGLCVALKDFLSPNKRP